MARTVIKIPALQLNFAKDGLHQLAPVGVALFPRTTLDLGQAALHTPQQFLEQLSAILEKRSPQPKLHGLQIANPAPRKIFSNQSQEGFGFAELLGPNLLRLEFFLPPSANWVI
jgi:hypothetical protein